MSVFLSPVGGAGAQFFDANGTPLSGGKLYTYSAGTTTPAVTYTSSAGNVSHSNPIILDAAGRVPGSSEIWLTDSVAYKFVLKDSNDVLQATWDNITGINSNFVNFTAQEEVQTATAGQTVFTLADITYTPGSNNLQVFVDGVNQIVDDSYLETNSTTVTFVSGLHVGALVKFTTAVSNSSGIETDAALVTYDPPFIGSESTTVEAKLAQIVSVKDFGATGDGVTDDTAALQAALDSGKPLRIPAGTYLYSSLTGLDEDNITISGDGSNCTVLKFTGTGIALDIGTSAGFKQGVNISGFTVEGNTNTTYIIRATAIARSMWSDINVREANKTTGVGFLFRSCMLSRFDFLVCSQDRNAMTNPPSEGVQIEALAPYGNSSNNTFINLYSEGAGVYPGVDSIAIGVRISGGDQNTFISGSPESCKTYGLLVGTGCRYNTFIGVGFENLDATADVADAGISTRYINCYASQKVVLQGELIEIAGGYYERIQVDAGAVRNTVHDIIINHWSTGSGGLYDSGTGTVTKNIYDEDAGAYTTDVSPRFLMTLNADQNNITGAGNAYTMAWDTPIDDNANCDGVYFTAPVKGRYQLSSTMTLKNLESTATEIQLEIRTTGGVFVTAKRLNLPAGNSLESITVSGIAAMNAGDGAYVVVTVTGMAGNTADAIGNPTNRWCTFSGYQIH